MATYINPNAIKDRSITSIKLANGLIVTDASIAALGYIKDVSNLATKSAAIGSLSLALDSSDYKITLSGTKVDGSEFTVQNVIDLPLESVVVDGSYNNTTKKIVLTLQNGSTVDFSVADLVAGLQSEITSSNKLSADLIQDGSTNQTVTATEKSTWNSKQNAISDLDTIRANASAGAAKVSNVQSDWDATTGLAVILNKPTIPSAPGTLNTNNSTAQTVASSEALSGAINLHKVAKTGTYSDLIGTPAMTSDASVAGWGYTKNAVTGVKFNNTDAIITNGIASITATIPAEVTESTVSGWGFTKNAGTLTGVKFNNTDATISGSTAVISATIPAAPGTLKTNNTSAQTASASESLSGTINLHKVAKTGTYSDLIGTPAEVTSSTVSGWGFTTNEGTITEITMNNTSKGTSGNVDLGTVITEHATHKLTATNNTASATTGEITFIESLTGTNTATSGDLTITATRKKITVPSAVTSDTVSGWGFTKNTGTLTGVKFNNVDATVTNGVASITATLPAAPGTLNTTATTAQSTSSSEALSGNITLHKVAKTGAYGDLTGTPTIPTVNNATLTIQKNGTNVQTFTANASNNVTANITVNELPTVTSSDNGKVLMVVNGAWNMVTPVSIYSGSAAPNNSQGINGDIYLQV